MTTVLPEIPPEMLTEWQRVVDLTARLARVPASLIMRTERPTHTVLVSSRTEGNPYDVGREYDLNAVLYCQACSKTTASWWSRTRPATRSGRPTRIWPTGQIIWIAKARTGRDLGFYEVEGGVARPRWPGQTGDP